MDKKGVSMGTMNMFGIAVVIRVYYFKETKNDVELAEVSPTAEKADTDVGRRQRSHRARGPSGKPSSPPCENDLEGYADG